MKPDLVNLLGLPAVIAVVLAVILAASAGRPPAACLYQPYPCPVPYASVR
jgi:hypothetical protein